MTTIKEEDNDENPHMSEASEEVNAEFEFPDDRACK